MSLAESISPYERVRAHAHADIDSCCDTWPTALLDAGCRGFPTAVMQPRSSGEAELTSVESAAIRTDFATGWIVELGDVIALFGLPSRPRIGTWDGESIRRPWHHAAEQVLNDWPPHAEQATKRLSVLANTARAHWTTRPAKGQTISGVTVGERTNSVETCGLCQEPVMGGASDPIRRIDGQAFHKSPCWYRVATNRGVR